jgi:photosystem II stability/assembly factor-like uncharacterized protein
MSELVVLSNGDLLGSTVGGFLRSGDGGRTWDTVAAAPAEISMTTLLPMSDGETLISGSTAGIYRSSDRGRTWDTSSTGMPARFGFSYSFGSNRAIVETWRAVYHSEDLVAWMRAPLAGRVLVDERDAYVIGTYDSLYRSVDGGGTWISVGRNPDGNNRLVTNGTGAIFAVDNNGGLRRSIDGGIKWVRYHFGASHGGAADLKFRGRTGVHATGGTGPASTTDNGDTWHYAKHDYTSSVAAVAPDLTSYALGEWYRSTGTFNGLFKLVYGDTIWQPVTAAQLPGTGDSATALIATDDGALFAIWNGRAYRSTSGVVINR